MKNLKAVNGCEFFMKYKKTQIILYTNAQFLIWQTSCKKTLLSIPNFVFLSNWKTISSS